MIPLLPTLRLLWRQYARKSQPWPHRPPQPPERATACGQCGEPVGVYPDGEFCSGKCCAAWLSALPVPERNQEPFTRPDISPEPPPEPPWMARLTAWERAKADRPIADRKSPTSEEETAA